MKFKQSLLIALAVTIFATGTMQPMNIKLLKKAVTNYTNKAKAGTITDAEIELAKKDIKQLIQVDSSIGNPAQRNFNAALKDFQDRTRTRTVSAPTPSVSTPSAPTSRSVTVTITPAQMIAAIESRYAAENDRIYEAVLAADGDAAKLAILNAELGKAKNMSSSSAEELYAKMYHMLNILDAASAVLGNEDYINQIAEGWNSLNDIKNETGLSSKERLDIFATVANDLAKKIEVAISAQMGSSLPVSGQGGTKRGSEDLTTKSDNLDALINQFSKEKNLAKQQLLAQQIATGFEEVLQMLPKKAKKDRIGTDKIAASLNILRSKLENKDDFEQILNEAESFKQLLAPEIMQATGSTSDLGTLFGQ